VFAGTKGRIGLDFLLAGGTDIGSFGEAEQVLGIDAAVDASGSRH